MASSCHLLCGMCRYNTAEEYVRAVERRNEICGGAGITAARGGLDGLCCCSAHCGSVTKSFSLDFNEVDNWMLFLLDASETSLCPSRTAVAA